MTPDPADEASHESTTLTAPHRLAAVDRTRRLLPVVSDALAGWAHVAAQAAGAPTGMVSIVGADAVYAVDAHNMPPSRWSTGQVPPSYSFCGRVIARGATLVLTDVRTDPELRSLPIVRDVGARSYLGVPLRGPDGELIGVLGLTDYVPRDWRPEQVTAAENAARLIAGMIAYQLVSSPDPFAAAPATVEPAAGPSLLSAVGRAEFVRALLDTVDANVMIVDAEGRAVPNEAMRALGLPVGWNVSEIQDVLRYLYHRDGRPMTAGETPVMRALAGEHVRGSQVVVRRSDGQEGELSINARPIDDDAGHRLGAILVAHDVTQARLLARFHECEVSIIRTLANSADLGDVAERVLGCMARTLGAQRAEFWLVDPVGGANRLVGLWPSASAATPCAGPPSPGLGAPPSPGLGAPPSPAPSGGRTAALTVPLVDAGTTFGKLVFHDTAPGRAGQATEFLDGIAAQLAQYVERRRAEELTVELSRTRDEFIALAGHTLRTPLTTIVSLTDLMLTAGDDLADQRHELLTRVSNSAGTLRTIVEDLLDLAGLESGHINLSPGPVDLAQLVGEAVEAATPTADAAELRLEAELPDHLPAVADGRRLRQAVDNLLSNAVKYSPGGGTVRVRLSAEETVAELSVADEGLGVPEADRERLFNRFFRGSTAHERGIPGTGLGLSLTRLIVELHGGTISLTDNAGPGATFTLRLPLVPDPRRMRPVPRRNRP